MERLPHADLVKPVAEAGPSRTGIRRSCRKAKARGSAGYAGSPYALANVTGCRGCWMSVRRTARPLA